jgi:transmembrane sensor
MSAPLKKEYLDIVNKFLNGEATIREKEILDRYYSLFEDEADVIALLSPEDIRVLENRMHERILNQIHHNGQTRVVPIYKRTWLRVAVAVLLVSAAAYLFYPQKQPSYNITALTRTDKPDTLTRFFTLPDGSKIVLRAGSSLTVAADFNKNKTREVSLTGEAYFDVVHNTGRPFIIHTGEFKTTVLGTAFNIKAYHGEKDITVTVTRGKVSVENKHKLIAVLTPNQQLVAARVMDKPVVIAPQMVNTVKELSWTKADMSFDAMPLGDLAKHLGKRYGVNITFKNPDLSACRITGGFTGTETLKEVLDVLSQTRNTTYQINGTDVVIDGEGCNE